MTPLSSNRVVKAAALISGAMLLWAVIELLGPAAGVSAYQVVWTRYATHLLFMLLCFGPRLGRRLFFAPRLSPLILRSLCMLGMPLSFVAAMKRMPYADVSAVFWISPALIMGLAGFLGERTMGLRSWVSVLGGFGGVLLFTSAGAGLMRPAAIAALGMACFFAVYVILTRQLRDEMVMTRLFHSAFWVWFVLSIAMPFVWRRPSGPGLAIMIAIGLIGWVALYLLDLALDEAPAMVLAPFLYTQFFWTALLEWLWRGSVPGLQKSIGLLVIGASMAVLLAGFRRSDALSSGLEAAEIR